MTKIENTLGKRIQITNSPIYCQLNKKIDLQFGMDYESLLMSISNLAHTMGRYMNADIGKIELYTSILGLGKIDGGKPVLDYINNNIQDDKSKIQEIDIMLYNLKKVFPDLEERFDKNDFIEFSELFSGNSSVIETKIIELAYHLKLVSQSLKKLGKLDDKGSTDYIFNEMQKIINHYQNTRRIDVSQEFASLASKFYNQPLDLDQINIEELNKMVHLYNVSEINKDSFIEQLNKLKIVKEKKNKVR